MSLLASRLPCRRCPDRRDPAIFDEEPLVVAKERVQSVLDRVRPYLNADGGDIELVAVEGNSAAARRVISRGLLP